MSFPFGPAALAVPVNILKAMPRVTESEYTDGIGGVAQIIGGHVSKVWDPNVVGINAQVPAQVNTKWCCVGTWLDLSPCKYFVAIIQRVQLAGASHATPTMTLQVQYRLSSVDAPPASRVIGAGINDPANAIFDVNTTAYAWPSLGTPMQERGVWAWGAGATAGNNARIMPVTLGVYATRLIMSWSTNDPTAAGADPSQYSVTLLGTT